MTTLRLQGKLYKNQLEVILPRAYAGYRQAIFR